MAGQPCIITFSLSYAHNGRPVPYADIMSMHDRLLHAVFVSRNLDIFLHVHPEDVPNNPRIDGQFPVPVTFPAAGMYRGSFETMVMWDNPATGIMEHTSVHRLFLVTVTGSPTFQWPVTFVAKDFLVEKSFLTFDLPPSESFTSPVIASSNAITRGTATAYSPSAAFGIKLAINDGKQVNPFACYAVTVTVTNGVGTENRTDLSLYLNAPLHVIAVHESLNELLHLHGDYVLPGEESKLLANCTPHSHAMQTVVYEPVFGPRLVFSVQFGMVGNYRIFMQTTAMGKTRMLAPSFMIRVGSLPPQDVEAPSPGGNDNNTVVASSLALHARPGNTLAVSILVAIAVLGGFF
jgi:hypothetical protein